MFLGKRAYEKAYELLKSNAEWDKEEEISDLDYIENKKGDTLFCMWLLGRRYIGRASMNLLNERDIKSFREDCYIYAKLNIMGEEGRAFLNGISILKIFPLICSNSRELWEFVMRNRDCIVVMKKLKRSEAWVYLSKTIITAMRGEWEDVIKMCDEYLETDLKDERLDFEFLKALALKDEVEMKKLIELMFDPKRTRAMQRGASVYFDFYLQMYVIIYAKIALYHGIDLGIDCDVAPKDIISNEELEEYPEPYEVMKMFNLKEMDCERWYEWIESWTSKS